MIFNNIFEYLQQSFQDAKNTFIGDSKSWNQNSRIEPRVLKFFTDETPKVLPSSEECIKWIQENVEFYPISKSIVYNKASAYDILMACNKFELEYQMAPRVFTVAVRWKISYEDAAEMIHAVESVQG